VKDGRFDHRVWQRFRRTVLVSLVILAMGNGLALWRLNEEAKQRQRAVYERCVAQNANTTRSRALLTDLARVGDADERAVWQRWARSIPDPPACGTPR
jgi:hypothetical protein